MNISRRTAITRSLAVMATGTLAGEFALAQAYPSRTIRIVVAFGPGGPSDLISRLVAQKMT